MAPEGIGSAIIETLAKHEEAIGGLYSTYVATFPDYEWFWSVLAAEEIAHATWIRKLDPTMQEGSADVYEGRFKMDAVRSSLRYVQELEGKARRRETSLTNAFSRAYDLEDSLIEKRIFEVFEGDTVEVRKTLLALAEATRVHRRTIEKAWGKARRQVEGST